jgi:hypothetical protein
MPFGSVRLVPGVNIERTPTLLEAGYNATALGRFRDGIFQKYGGWSLFYGLTIPGVPRDMHAWSDLNSVNRLLVGTTTQLGVITNGSLQDITPQTLTTNGQLFQTILGSPLVEVTDTAISNVTVYDSALFDTPVAIGGLILAGLYQIVSVTGANKYKINAGVNAASNAGPGVSVPVFTTAVSTSLINVNLTAHNAALNSTVVFRTPTTGNGVTISGAYTVASVVDANNFTINGPTIASASGSFSMNGGASQLTYYIALGPPPIGSGYGLGGYGLGGYGTGVSAPNQTGNPITSTDCTSDNWGQIAIACPENGGVYYWDPNGGFTNASLIASGPTFNRGIFVSTSQQILIAYGSTINETTNGGFGLQQDPMIVAWCEPEDFFTWLATDTNLAGNYRIPTGSSIVVGLAVANQNLIWTDLDLWVMNFIGYPDTFGFNKIGSGAGACSSHSVQPLRGGVYWMGKSNFYAFTGGNVTVIPCPVWDAVFQNLNTAYIKNVRAMPNTPFNEAGWLYPSAASVNGENDSYVKFNISEPGAPWDYGQLARSAWIDQTVLGPPIGALPAGVVYQHETGNDAAGAPMFSGFRSGYFELGDGEDFIEVDQVFPDFKWGTFAGLQTAQVLLVFFVRDSAGDETGTGVRQYGPYTVTANTPYISVRFRGRQMAVGAASSDLGSFWRLGRIRYRYRKSGRR